MTVKKLDDNLWIVGGETVSFYSMPYSTRMTVARLATGELWIHSPIRLTPELKAWVSGLGAVAYLIAPNSLHHLYLAEWQQAFPEARTYGTREVISKRQDLPFNGELRSSEDEPWSDELEQELFTGSKAMEECVFFHRQSGTLIVTDLIENFSPTAFNRWQRLIARAVGVLAPNGKMPLDWRLSFLFSKATARTHFQRILAWQPRRIIMAHGELVETNAPAFLRRSFSWLA